MAVQPSAAGVVAERHQLTPAWFTAALAPVAPGVTVHSVELERIGTGQMGESYRARLDHGLPPDVLPDTVVVKLPVADPAARALVAGVYRCEVAFYTELATELAVRTPHCWYAASSEDGTAFVLVLEDLHPAEQGDQLAGCTVAQARSAVRNLAGLHAPRWCDPTLTELETLTLVDDAGAALLHDITGLAVEQFAEHFAGAVHDDDLATLRAVTEVVDRWVLGRPERFGLLHGDYRLDNLLFHGGDDPQVAAVDWQTLALGLPARDLAFFLGTGLEAEHRRVHEQDLVATYHDELCRQGVVDYPAHTCFEDYRFGMLQGPLITVLGAAYGTRTDRGDAMFVTMIRRSCQAVRDLGSLDLV
jgi:hypothetical protein